MNNGLFNQLGQSLRKPEFWAYSSWLDIVTRYRRTRLGLLWLLAPVTLFTFVTGPLYAGLTNRELSFYLVHLGMGYAIWRMLSLVISDAVGSLRDNKPFIMDGNVRLTDYALKSIAKASFYFVFSMIGMLGVLIWSPAVPAWAPLTLFVTIPIIVLNLFWIGYCVALLGARSPDFGQALQTLLMMGMLFTPIIWVGDRFPADSMAGFVVRLNPAYHMLEVVRAPLYGHVPERSSIMFIAIMTVSGWGFSAVLCHRYSRYVPIWI